MTLTVETVSAEIRRALRRDLDARWNIVEFVNRVGGEFISLEDWRYLDGKLGRITLQPNTQTYTLPVDFVEAQSFRDLSGREVVTLTPDWAYWQRAASFPLSLGTGLRYLGAINAEVREPTDQDEGVYSILWLTPVPGETEDIIIRYRAGWKRVTSQNDVLLVPRECEEAFLALARAMAIGFARPSTDGNPDMVEPLKAQVRTHPAWLRAVRAWGKKVGVIQPAGGPFVRAAADIRRGSFPGPAYSDQAEL